MTVKSIQKIWSDMKEWIKRLKSLCFFSYTRFYLGQGRYRDNSGRAENVSGYRYGSLPIEKSSTHSKDLKNLIGLLSQNAIKYYRMRF